MRFRYFAFVATMGVLAAPPTLADFKLDLSSYEIGDIPTVLGTNLIVKERDGQKSITGHANAQQNTGRLELSSLNLSSEF